MFSKIAACINIGWRVRRYACWIWKWENICCLRSAGQRRTITHAVLLAKSYPAQTHTRLQPIARWLRSVWRSRSLEFIERNTAVYQNSFPNSSQQWVLLDVVQLILLSVVEKYDNPTRSVCRMSRRPTFDVPKNLIRTLSYWTSQFIISRRTGRGMLSR